MAPTPRNTNISIYDCLCLGEPDSEDEIFEEAPPAMDEVESSEDEVEHDPYPGITAALVETQEYIHRVIKNRSFHEVVSF